MGIKWSPKIFKRVQYLIIFCFLEDSDIFQYLKLFGILEFMGCIAPIGQKFTSVSHWLWKFKTSLTSTIASKVALANARVSSLACQNEVIVS
jgi:hypothetical protein